MISSRSYLHEVVGIPPTTWELIASRKHLHEIYFTNIIVTLYQRPVTIHKTGRDEKRLHIGSLEEGSRGSIPNHTLGVGGIIHAVTKLPGRGDRVDTLRGRFNWLGLLLNTVHAGPRRRTTTVPRFRTAMPQCTCEMGATRPRWLTPH